MARLLAIVMALGSCGVAGAVVEIFFTSSSDPAYGLSDPNLVWLPTAGSGADAYAYALLDPDALPPFATPTIDPTAGEWLNVWIRFKNEPHGGLLQGLHLEVQPGYLVEQVAYYQLDSTALFGPNQKRWDTQPSLLVVDPVIFAAINARGLRSHGSAFDWEPLWVGQWPNSTYLLGAVRMLPGQYTAELKLGNLGIQYVDGAVPLTALGTAQVASPPCTCDCYCRPDCNDNGRDDACDVADGSSADCNSNGIPDECETASVHGYVVQHYTQPNLGGVTRSSVQASIERPCGFDAHSVRVRTWLHTTPISGAYRFTPWYVLGYWPQALRIPLRIGGTWYQPDSTFPYSVRATLEGDRDYEVYFEAPSHASITLQWKPPESATMDPIPTAQLTTGRDCNGNGVLDDCDINTSTSYDVNGNAAPDECDFCLGDVNCDGVVNHDDVDPFVAALSHPGGVGWTAACDWLSADANHDGQVTFADIDPFVARLGATCPALPR